MFTVADMMTLKPHTLSRNDTLFDAKEMMQTQSIRHIPITDHNHHLLGLISQRDVLAAQDSNLKSVITNPCYSPLEVLLEHCMNRNIFSVDSHAGLKEAALYMQKNQIGCLPVLENKQLVGIITNSDFVAIAVTLLEMQDEVDPIEQDNLDELDDIDIARDL
ncbi:acetoin utilization protein AcuB [Photobacterium iliopiscarium]|jgi:CBS domain-containing protein|uniref:CBS domain-containing protein n=1 Tax=Photobacterium iliopiscarium TaxID=56192 RepID=A0A0D8PW33_9GAMM|nr:CBS domain-containing protein [Photobacterium iliopiscarium]KJG12508.1 acetoin utilization protein AcuB [Photobacterium iliopiscarium]KJG22162.1 acetoin utilization protein AcuB [Photobacterium iliopiscarium]MCD9467549.1 acetoin utilization protein AcuB [Photobacterium iliopiscarium]MCD9487992.1 CBS domain-containing protein [Photobacterium iliopiscarium]MCF2243973.1 CBS domain-containing protein [Photobacterium iliopiscarium]